VCERSVITFFSFAKEMRRHPNPHRSSRSTQRHRETKHEKKDDDEGGEAGRVLLHASLFAQHTQHNACYTSTREIKLQIWWSSRGIFNKTSGRVLLHALQHAPQSANARQQVTKEMIVKGWMRQRSWARAAARIARRDAYNANAKQQATDMMIV
jgi:hypothetical protein